MATVVNDRDVLMQATTPRYTSGGASQNTAVVYIYQRSASASAPTLPSAASTYTFATGGLTGLNNGWSSTIPGGTQKYLYVAMVTVSGTGATFTIPASPTTGSWNAAVLLSSNGIDGINGSNGSNGSNGMRGTVTLAASGYSGWSDSSANTVVASNTGTGPITGDIVTLYDASHSTTKFYAGGTWSTLSAYINGNMLVSGTLVADIIAAGSNLSGVNISGGSLNIGSSTFVVSSSGILTLNGLMQANYGGQFFQGPSFPAVTGSSSSSQHGVWAINTGSGYALRADGGSSLEAVLAQNTSGTSSAHGIRGKAKCYTSWTPPTGISGGGSTAVTTSTITSGLVGAANGYDFYADGGGTNYGPFTGSHDVLWPIGATLVTGDIVIDTNCIARGGWSNTIFEVEVSSRPYQPAAIGVLATIIGPLSEHMPAVFIESREFVVDPAGPSPEMVTVESISSVYEAAKSLYTRGAANALGEGQLNVCGEGGNIKKGDFIVTSSTPGKGMRMDMNLPATFDLMSCIVARAREACIFSTADEVKAVACIYLCG